MICALPFVIISARQKRSEKRFLKVLLDYAIQNQLSLSQHEIVGNQAIALSEAGNSILFLKRRNNNDQLQQIDLEQIDRCYVNKPSRGSIDGSYSLMERIELRFAFRDKNKQETVFELYNMEHDSMSMNGELLMAEKWNTIANARVKK
jgi:hypothetical protein